MLKQVSDELARSLLLDIAVSLKTEAVGLADSFGRILAEDVFARIMVPPFDRSPFDGYALRGADTLGASRENPVIFRITEEIPAGKAPELDVTAGTAAKILTGAPIPNGADATVKYEGTAFTDTEVKIFEPVKPGDGIVPAGEDTKKGELLAEKGSVITGPVMGVLAGQGIASISVYKRPIISILTTGSELLDIGEPLLPAKIYNSNVHTLSGYLRSFGAQPVNGGIVEDDFQAIAGRIGELLETSDMVITTGGASVGDYDWAVAASQHLGADVLFWKTAMKPGGSMLASRKGDKVILGLSGNPGAAVLGLLVVGRAYIRKLCGMTDTGPETVEVIMKEPFMKTDKRPRFIRGRLSAEGGKAYLIQTNGDGNGMVSPFVKCDLIGVIPVKDQPAPAGTIIKAYKV